MLLPSPIQWAQPLPKIRFFPGGRKRPQNSGKSPKSSSALQGSRARPRARARKFSQGLIRSPRCHVIIGGLKSVPALLPSSFNIRVNVYERPKSAPFSSPPALVSPRLCNAHVASGIHRISKFLGPGCSEPWWDGLRTNSLAKLQNFIGRGGGLENAIKNTH